ncbi:MAG: two pore domain potassium channel family protein [Betaproteobacteria bacterium]|nr:two pore domain potassium channel family protein [Betaproteobacteria bacterium]
MIHFWFFRKRARPTRMIEHPSIGRTLIRAAVLIAILIFLHVLAMKFFEDLPAFDGFWLTLTTLFTVGYGDLAAKTYEGRWATILLIYLGGIYTLANFAGQWFEWRADALARKRCGTWRWQMNDHLLILNSPLNRPEAYFERLLKQVRHSPRFAHCPVLIITRAFDTGLPESLARLGAAHVAAWGLDFEALRDSGPARALAIAILAKSEADPASDSVTLDAIERVRSLGKDVHLVVECLDDQNRARMIKAGASAVVRPTRVFPEIMARALAHPGSEKVLEEIIDVGGAECMRLELAWSGQWKDLVGGLIDAGVGTALGYESAEGAVLVNPRPSEQITALAIFALVSGDLEGAQARAMAALRASG